MTPTKDFTTQSTNTNSVDMPVLTGDSVTDRALLNLSMLIHEIAANPDSEEVDDVTTADINYKITRA